MLQENVAKFRNIRFYGNFIQRFLESLYAGRQTNRHGEDNRHNFVTFHLRTHQKRCTLGHYFEKEIANVQLCRKFS
jgi:hypothetical protein